MRGLIKNFTIFAIVIIVVFGGLIGGVYGYVMLRNKMEYKAEQKAFEERMISDVQPILYYAGAIMGGQVLEENEENELKQYNLQKDFFPTVVSFYVDIKLTAVKHDFHTGYMDVIYTQKYIDGTGKCMFYTKDKPATWDIEKKDGKWYVTSIYEDIYKGV